MAILTQQNVIDYLGRTLGANPGQDAQIAFLVPRADAAVKKYVGYPVEQATFTDYYPEVAANLSSDDDMLVTGYEMSNGKAVPYGRGDNARTVLQLTKIPARSVVSIYENPGAWATAGGSWPPNSLLDPASYFLDAEAPGICTSGQLLRRAGAWTTARRAIKITYVAGYTAAELDATQGGAFYEFQAAAIDAVVGWLMAAALKNRAALSGGLVQSQGLDGLTVTMMNPLSTGLLSMISNDLPASSKQMLEGRLSMRKFW